VRRWVQLGIVLLGHHGLPRFRALHAGGNTPTSCLVSYYLHSGYNAPRVVRSRGGRRRSDPPSLRVQTPLYRWGSGYRLGGWPPSSWLLHGCVFGMIFWPPDSFSDGDTLQSAFPPWTGIWEAYALPFAWDPFVGKAPASWLVESGRGLRHAHPSPLSILSGQATFGETAVGGILSSSPGSGSLRWSHQPAAGAAGPLDGAGLLVLALWRFLGRQPTDSVAPGIP
jgi:hypothetical protein